MEDFGRAIALEPDNIESLRNRAILYRELGEPDKAVRDYDEIIRLEPNDTSVREERQQAVAEAAGREAEPAAEPTPCKRTRGRPAPMRRRSPLSLDGPCSL